LFFKKIANHFQKRFLLRPNPKQNLSPGIYNIALIFKIDINGNFVSARARAKNTLLENEALRIVGLLPQVIPAKISGTPCVVPYSLPIQVKIPKK